MNDENDTTAMDAACEVIFALVLFFVLVGAGLFALIVWRLL